MMNKILNHLDDIILCGCTGLIVVGLLLITGVQVGRYLERIDGQSSFALCNRYVAVLGNQLEIEKKKNRTLITGIIE
jgi:hypothetical protein